MGGHPQLGTCHQETESKRRINAVWSISCHGNPKSIPKHWTAPGTRRTEHCATVPPSLLFAASLSHRCKLRRAPDIKNHQNESQERTHLYRFARVLSSPMGFPNACPRDINSPSYPSYANSCSYQMKESIQDSMTTSHFVVIKDAM